MIRSFYAFRFIVACWTSLLLLGCESTSVPERQQIIDVHYHASWPEGDDTSYLSETLAEMDANAIVMAVLFVNAPDDVDNWVKAAPGRFLAGPGFPCFVRNAGNSTSCDWNGEAWPDIDWLRARYESGDFHVMGEMTFIYAGVSHDDPRMEPYWSLAEELDIPVSVHINRGPPIGAPPRVEGCCANFNEDLGNPSLLEPVLQRHPGLRIWLNHAGIPPIPESGKFSYMEETVALLKTYTNVYVDFSILNSVFDAGSHEDALRRFIAEGLIDRVMFGSDNMPADTIISRLEGFDFLTDEQRQGIFYENAARFFRL